MDEVASIRARHKSARPKASNPAWMNSEHDMARLFIAYDAAVAENERLRADAEVHWKTRRSQLVEIEYLRALVIKARSLQLLRGVADEFFSTADNGDGEL
jgi:hypothetical protein